MTERQRDSVIRRWNQCDRRTRVRIAAEFFLILRAGAPQDDWWRFLQKKLPTLN